MQWEYEPPQDFADHAIRESLRDVAKLREIIEDVLPAEIVARLDFTKVEYVKPKFMMEDWCGRAADILVLVPFSDQDETKVVLICVLVEHQSKADRLMPLRMGLIAFLFWDQQWREYKKAHPKGDSLQLTPIIPIVLHTGSRPWTSCKSIADLFAGPEILKAFAPKWDLLFWDLGEKSPEKLLASEGFFRQFLAIVLREHDEQSEFRATVEQFISQLETLFAQDRMSWRDYFRLLFAWIVQRRPMEEREDLTSLLVDRQEYVRARREAKLMTTSTKESVTQYHYRLGVETGLTALREVLLRLLGNVSSPSQELVASINACEDVAKLKAAILGAAKLTTLEGFSL